MEVSYFSFISQIETSLVELMKRSFENDVIEGWGRGTTKNGDKKLQRGEGICQHSDVIDSFFIPIIYFISSYL